MLVENYWVIKYFNADKKKPMQQALSKLLSYTSVTKLHCRVALKWCYVIIVSPCTSHQLPVHLQRFRLPAFSSIHGALHHTIALYLVFWYYGWHKLMVSSYGSINPLCIGAYCFVVPCGHRREDNLLYFSINLIFSWETLWK